MKTRLYNIGSFLAMISMISSLFFIVWDILVLLNDFAINIFIQVLLSIIIAILTVIMVSVKKSNKCLTIITTTLIAFLLIYPFIMSGLMSCSSLINLGLYIIALIGGVLASVASFQNKKSNN